MDIELKLREVVDAERSLQKVLGRDLDNFKLAYRLRRLADKVLSELRHFSKLRDEKIRELGEIDKASGLYRVKPENAMAFQDQLNALMDSEIVKLDVALIPVDLLEAEASKPESKFKLSANDLAFLDRFIDHESVVKPKGKADISPSPVPNKE